MFDIYWEQEKQIIKALNALYNEKYSSICVTVLAFDITPRILL